MNPVVQISYVRIGGLDKMLTDNNVLASLSKETIQQQDFNRHVIDWRQIILKADPPKKLLYVTLNNSCNI